LHILCLLEVYMDFEDGSEKSPETIFFSICFWLNIEMQFQFENNKISL